MHIGDALRERQHTHRDEHARDGLSDGRLRGDVTIANGRHRDDRPIEAVQQPEPVEEEVPLFTQACAAVRLPNEHVV